MRFLHSNRRRYTMLQCKIKGCGKSVRLDATQACRGFDFFFLKAYPELGNLGGDTKEWK
ncbi:hypothetical protein QO002_001351 [Pararhizobium capsulatum DSM 1112]|uniref:Uncharacterized protein n=1 Tax=Pararhizobium capsulatum DSM 1112 TaxID=1121113 RepID=A0ABU0BLU5_9HYPH|nr:hypothetical protein [Pararhizobium capsulatum]MDQ0319213.1 hypothetical protein [Pararhizobium capsulatum DSM 1112]